MESIYQEFNPWQQIQSERNLPILFASRISNPGENMNARHPFSYHSNNSKDKQKKGGIGIEKKKKKRKKRKEKKRKKRGGERKKSKLKQS
ncbi:hypothetical protein VTO42DRAFT_2193 [Malbranchea cinnamomea]